MKVFIMRHCLATEGERMDATRALDDVGELQAKVMKRFMKKANVNPDLVISSDFERAHQTARVVNRGVEIVTTPMLRPDSTPEKAWKAVVKLAGDSKSILVVTHGPLIEPFLAAVAFGINPSIHWYHGSVAYVNTGESRFRWFVTPKLAAHIVGEDPKEVESDMEPTMREAGRAMVELSEHLMRTARKSMLDPLEKQMRAVVRRALRSGSKQLAPRKYKAITKAAMQAGAQIALAQLGPLVKEAKKPKPEPRMPDPKRTAELANSDIDWSDSDTSEDRIDTIAGYEVSKAFHDGLLEMADMWRGGNGPVEKIWAAQPDACDVCSENEDEGPIDFEAPFSSGDFEPPAHPNCRCSLDLQEAEE